MNAPIVRRRVTAAPPQAPVRGVSRHETQLSSRPVIETVVIEPKAFINKYRPATWSHMVGQEGACKQVYAAMDVNTHLYLFHGPAGCGKTSMARLLAMELDCELRELDGATKGGVDDVRALVESLTYRALSASGRRMVVLDECHRLSKEAWTALLKPTEEPDSHVFYALCTTEPSKVPPTIRSRTVSIELSPLSRADLFKLLDEVADAEKFHINDSGLRIIAEAANGSPRQALAMLAACHSADTDAEVRKACAVAGEDPDIIELARGLVAQRLTWPKVVGVLQTYEGQAESVRLLIVNYTAKVLLGTTDAKKAMPLLAILDAFREPCSANEKMAPVLRMFGYILMGGV